MNLKTCIINIHKWQIESRGATKVNNELMVIKYRRTCLNCGKVQHLDRDKEHTTRSIWKYI